MGLTFENSGVSGVNLSSPYLPGTLRDQAQKAADAAGVNLYIDDGQSPPTGDQSSGNTTGGTLAIWPKNGSRGGEIPLISPETGLVGYPTFTDSGVLVKCLFNPNLKPGGQFKLKASVLPNEAIWNIRYLNLELDANTPGGSWFSVIDAMLPATGSAGAP
jgi:hypothetical protein